MHNIISIIFTFKIFFIWSKETKRIYNESRTELKRELIIYLSIIKNISLNAR